ncbi:class I SAM-dependent methyltransferase [Streptomyces sp. NBC_00133]|uniref:class I SAM-dependent methyltransferase n=1 Tax=Streptomyces sp. NBC_00133 TaxID=2903624 RepID=UPI003248103F
MNADRVNQETWETVGRHYLERQKPCPIPDSWDWAMYGTGPGVEVLGDVAGQRVLDLGCGSGRHAAYLADCHGALVEGVDYSTTQLQRAQHHFGHLNGVHFHHADAVDHLKAAAPYDVIYSVLGLMYVDPHQLLPALAAATQPGARLVASVLHTSVTGAGPSTTVTPRTEKLTLPGAGTLPVRMWVLAPETWERLLAEHHFTVEAIAEISPEGSESPVSCRLIQARRTHSTSPTPTPAA